MVWGDPEYKDSPAGTGKCQRRIFYKKKLKKNQLLIEVKRYQIRMLFQWQRFRRFVFFVTCPFPQMQHQTVLQPEPALKGQVPSQTLAYSLSSLQGYI